MTNKSKEDPREFIGNSKNPPPPTMTRPAPPPPPPVKKD
ncbi:Uncharacterised protein [Yersinia enterocolitica]|nr:Uncharacterised protein [Yersinia enterocolitica]CQD55257.1 Uncharacterised protein [Yersinia enterocolitica]